jgi:hypothetical protein
MRQDDISPLIKGLSINIAKRYHSHRPPLVMAQKKKNVSMVGWHDYATNQVNFISFSSCLIQGLVKRINRVTFI